MKQILFNTEMVRVILEGRKTVTRRVVKPQPPAGVTRLEQGAAPDRWRSPGKDVWVEIRAPYQSGDILWVRETFTVVPDGSYIYKASVECPDAWKGTWKSPYYMTRETARIFLRVTGVRVERLQDIDDSGVMAEGLEIGCYFDDLWNRITKPADRPDYGWDANPWVWVIEFERISKEEAMA